jgi:hypothetical protein
MTSSLFYLKQKMAFSYSEPDTVCEIHTVNLNKFKNGVQHTKSFIHIRVKKRETQTYYYYTVYCIYQ